MCPVCRDVVDEEEGQRRHGGKEELVAPSQVQHVVGEAQHQHARYGEESRHQLDKLVVGELVVIFVDQVAAEGQGDHDERQHQEDAPCHDASRLGH